MKRLLIFLLICQLSLTAALAAGDTPIKNAKISGTSAITAGTFNISTGVVMTFLAGSELDVSLGTLTLAANQVGWTKVNKTGSSLADLGTRSAGDLNSGTLNVSRLDTGTAANKVVLGGVITAGGPVGSATEVPVITYNAAGQITGISTVTITGGGGSSTFITLTDAPSSYTGEGGKAVAVKTDESGLEFVSGGGSGDTTRIGQQVLSSTASSVSFTSIPGTYSNLRLVIQGRTNAAGANEEIGLQFNSDTTSGDYIWSLNETNSAGTGVGGFSNNSDSSIHVLVMPGAGSTANFANSASIEIQGYAGTTFYKTAAALTDSYNTNIRIGVWGGIWKNTSAITSMTLVPTAGNSFIAGDTFTLYGLK